MIINFIRKNIMLIIIFSLWFFLFGSINIYPIDLLNIKSFFDIIKAVRIITPIAIGISIFIFLLIKFLKNKKKIFIPKYLSIFFFIFFFQFIGAFFADRINFETLYVIFLSFILIILFIFIEYLEIQKIYSYFLYLLIFFILISSLLLFSLKFSDFLILIKNLNIYSLFNPDKELLGYPPPRATGYSRMLATLSLFIIALTENKKKPINNPYVYIVLILSTLMWQFQSRGTYLCYCVCILFIIFILNYNKNLFNKLIKLVLYIFGPIIISFFLSIILIKTAEKNSINSLEKEEFIEIFLNNRIITEKSSTGRIDLWKIGLNEYDKNKLFGYGPQADRVIISKYFIKKKKVERYGNNISNGLIYTFLSGGYLSVLLFAFLYLINIFYIFKYIKTSEKKEDLPNQLSFIYIIFFSIRSLFENSYAVWGIDFMFLLISMAIINYQFSSKKNK
jgi:O-antigen ligase